MIAIIRLVLFRGDLLHGVLPALRDDLARADRKYRVTLLAGFAFRACNRWRHWPGSCGHTPALAARCRAPLPTTV